LRIIPAQSEQHIQLARELFRAYSAELQVDLCFQNFEKELAELPGDYAPPAGQLWLAFEGDEVAGCVALRSLGENISEMKRLYVRPAFRGTGAGRELTEHLIAEARELGYSKLRLDTLPDKMAAAISLYRARGFREIDRYYDNPFELAIFMELDL
jgi:ribosomal protein S18 acetylase RimI-like enzyme